MESGETPTSTTTQEQKVIDDQKEHSEIKKSSSWLEKRLAYGAAFIGLIGILAACNASESAPNQNRQTEIPTNTPTLAIPSSTPTNQEIQSRMATAINEQYIQPMALTATAISQTGEQINFPEIAAQNALEKLKKSTLLMQATYSGIENAGQCNAEWIESDDNYAYLVTAGHCLQYVNGETKSLATQIKLIYPINSEELVIDVSDNDFAFKFDGTFSGQDIGLLRVPLKQFFTSFPDAQEIDWVVSDQIEPTDRLMYGGYPPYNYYNTPIHELSFYVEKDFQTTEVRNKLNAQKVPTQFGMSGSGLALFTDNYVALYGITVQIPAEHIVSTGEVAISTDFATLDEVPELLEQLGYK